MFQNKSLLKMRNFLFPLIFSIQALNFSAADQGNCFYDGSLTFDKFIAGASGIRWVKYLGNETYGNGTRFRGFFQSCDPNDCMTCTMINNEIEVDIPQRDCFDKFRATLGTYIIAIRESSESFGGEMLDSYAPIQIKPWQWTVFSKLCAFQNSSLYNSYRVSKPSNCPNVIETIADFTLRGEDCIRGNVTLQQLYKMADNYIQMDNNASFPCIQQSSSFKERLQYAGAATIVKGINMQPPDTLRNNLFQVLSPQICNETLCGKDLPISKRISYGNAYNLLLNSITLKYPVPDFSSFCFQYSAVWRESQFGIDSNYYLFFHTPIRCLSSPIYSTKPNDVWVVAEPVILTSELWLNISQLCYFNAEKSTCVDDDLQLPLANLTLPSTTTAMTTTTTTPTTTTPAEEGGHKYCNRWANPQGPTCLQSSDCLWERLSLSPKTIAIWGGEFVKNEQTDIYVAKVIDSTEDIGPFINVSGVLEATPPCNKISPVARKGNYIHFVTKKEKVHRSIDLYTIVAESITAVTRDVWTLTQLQCGVSSNLDDCIGHVAVSELIELNYPHQDCKTSSQCPQSSDCLSERLEISEYAFYGHGNVMSDGLYNLTILCQLKGFFMFRPTWILANSSVQELCGSFNRLPDENLRLFFVKWGDPSKKPGYPGIPYVITASSISMSNENAYNLAKKQCGITQYPNVANETFCGVQTRDVRPGCLFDVSVDEIESLSLGIVTPVPPSPSPSSNFFPTPPNQVNLGCENLPSDAAKPRCNSDWLLDRFATATDVFWGSLVSNSATGMVHCFLKRTHVGYLGTTFQYIPAPVVDCNGQPIEKPDGDVQYIFFSNYDWFPGKFNYVPSALPVQVTDLEMWNAIKRLCYITLEKPDPSSQLPFAGNCDPDPNPVCFCNISIAALPEVPPLHIPTTTLVPVQGCEDFPVHEKCDSPFVIDRLEISTNVFWGELIGNYIKIFCWLKLEPEFEPTSVKEMRIMENTNFCGVQDGGLNQNISNQTYLFFTDKITIGEIIYHPKALPVLIKDASSWERVTNICNCDFQEAISYRLYPFGYCRELTFPPCSCTITVASLTGEESYKESRSKIRENEPFATRTCAETSDSLYVRFSSGGKLSSSIGPALLVTKTKQTLQDTWNLTEVCALQPEETAFQDQIVLKAPLEPVCYPHCMDDSFPFSIILVSIQNQENDEITSLVEPVKLRTLDSWLAVEQMCFLRSFKNVTRFGNCSSNLTLTYEQIQGCFLDISAAALERFDESTYNTLNLNCMRMQPNYFKDRLALATNVIWGKITDNINFANRSFIFQISSNIKGSILGDLVQVKAPEIADGCFLIDNESVGAPMILFIDTDRNMVGREIYASDLHCSLFVSSCDVAPLVFYNENCQPVVDRSVSCLLDVTIDVVINKIDRKEDAFLYFKNVSIFDAFTLHQSTLFTVAYDNTEYITWATVDSIYTLTAADPAAQGDRFIKMALNSHCIMKSLNGSASPIILVRHSTLTADIHVGSEYIFMLRKIVIFNPWPDTEYQLVAPPVPASRSVWSAMAKIAGVEAYPIQGRGGVRCEYQENFVPLNFSSQIDFASQEISCPGGSDLFDVRVNAGNSVTYTFYGQAIQIKEQTAEEISSNVNQSLTFLNRISVKSTGIIQNIIFQPFCVLSADDGAGDRPVAPFEFYYYSAECYHNESNTISLNQKYTVFINSVNYVADSAPIPIDQDSMILIKEACAIHPPPWRLYDPNFLNVCPETTANPCFDSVRVSMITTDHPYVPPQSEESNWWVYLLVTFAVICVLLVAAVLYLKRRKKVHHHSLHTNNELYMDDEDDTFLTELQSDLDANHMPTTSYHDQFEDPVMHVLRRTFSEAQSSNTESEELTSRSRLISAVSAISSVPSRPVDQIRILPWSETAGVGIHSDGLHVNLNQDYI